MCAVWLAVSHWAGTIQLKDRPQTKSHQAVIMVEPCPGPSSKHGRTVPWTGACGGVEGGGEVLIVWSFQFRLCLSFLLFADGGLG